MDDRYASTELLPLYSSIYSLDSSSTILPCEYKASPGYIAVDRYDERPLPRLSAQRLICGLGLGLQDQNFDIPTSRFFIGSSLQDHPRLDEVL